MKRAILLLCLSSITSCYHSYYEGVPKLVIPDAWVHPPYEELKSEFVDGPEGKQCIALADLRRMLKNQAMCDQARRSMIELFDVLGLEAKEKEN